MRNGFHFINRNRVGGEWEGRIGSLFGKAFSSELHFLEVITTRIKERISHGFGGPLMVENRDKKSVELEVPVEKGGYLFDPAKQKKLLHFIDTLPAPLFAQIHFDNTKWELGERVGKFDAYVEQVVSELKKLGRYENAMIVVHSDHGRRYNVDRRIPLIVKFPKQYSVRDSGSNVQLLDVAPTILDVVGIDIPEPMEGRSLLKPVGKYDAIFGVASHYDSPGLPLQSLPHSTRGGPRSLIMTVCNRLFRLDCKKGRFTAHDVRDYETSCDSDRIPSDPDGRKRLIQHLESRAYDVSRF